VVTLDILVSPEWIFVAGPRKEGRGMQLLFIPETFCRFQRPFGNAHGDAWCASNHWMPEQAAFLPAIIS
jgi:hypothetical protein